MNILESKYKVEIDHITIEEWTEILHLFIDSSVYQTWQYGAIRWGKENISHLILKKDNETVAAAQLRIVKLPVFNGGMAYLRWGPIWKLKGKESNIEDFHHIIKCLYNEYVLKRGLYLRILPNVFDNDQISNNILSIFKEEGFNRKQSTYRTLFLDLLPSIEELRANLSQKWRQDLKKSEKNNLKVIEGTGDELFDEVYKLYLEMLDRKNFIPGIDVTEFREIQRQLPESLKMKIVLCGVDGKTLNAIVSSYMGDRGIYLIGATATEGLRFSGSFLVQWKIIQWLKEQGCKWYDLCGIDPVKNPGGYHFKTGLAGKSGKDVWQLGQFDVCKNILSFFAVSLMEFLTKMFGKIHEIFKII
jgi:lipid II:glycine glycyltransferase (peptidoglycan interpeptide bridge formation enzyme)